MKIKINNLTKPFLFFIVLALSAFPVWAAPKLPLLHPLFCDHAVLQRDTQVPVWGWSEPGAKVSVMFAGQKYSTVAGLDGKWVVKLKAMPASAEPRTLTVTSSVGQAAASISDVLVGDVWLCSGQSNMEMGMLLTQATNDIATANFPNLRLLTVPHTVSLEPLNTVNCSWQLCSPATLSHGSWEGFSAVAFYFGRELHQELGVPIGLIQSAWGGTMAEAWTSADALATLGDFNDALATVRTQARPGNHLNYSQIYDQWYAQHEEGSRQGWQKFGVDVSGWQPVAMPQPFSKVGLGNFDGTTWFRHEFLVPENWPTTAAAGLGRN